MNRKFLILDFEYREDRPGRLSPVCVVAQDLESGRVYRQWLDGIMPSSPGFPCDENTILVAHSIAPAEGLCWAQLGWPEPGGWICTYVEERVLACGEKLEGGFKLLGCCARRGVATIGAEEKSFMRDLILSGGPYSDDDRENILDYCESDVVVTARLFEQIVCDQRFNEEQALFRGRFAAECSRITNRGIPVDLTRLRPLLALSNMQLRELISEFSDDYGIAPEGKWSTPAFNALVATSGINWPRTQTGKLKSDKNTLKMMGEDYGSPWIEIARLKRNLTEAMVNGLRLRDDGRLISDLHPFGAITGRCTPRSRTFLPAKPKWLRLLIQAPPGRTIISADWSSQEYAIAATLSRDRAMINAYLTGDPYLDLGRRCGSIPPDGTKSSHPKERDAYKVVSLAVLMGMGAVSIGLKTELGTSGGERLLRLHKRVFPDFWEWTEKCGNNGGAGRDLETVFGLVYNPAPESYKPRTAKNFLLQATASDMLRVAVVLLVEAGVEIVATVHDSIMVECDTIDADRIEKLLVEKMEEASSICLHDMLKVRVEVDRADHPLHFFDENGFAFFEKIAAKLGLELDSRESGLEVT